LDNLLANQLKPISVAAGYAKMEFKKRAKTLIVRRDLAGGRDSTSAPA
jgi:hypothetical protein